MAVEGFRLSGEIDLANADSIGDQLRGAMAASGSQPSFDVDCSGLWFLDSSGLRMLVEVCRELQAQGRTLRLFGLGGSPRYAVEITGLTQLLGVATADAA